MENIPLNPSRKYVPVTGVGGGAALSYLMDGKAWYSYWQTPRMNRDPWVSFLKRIWVSPLRRVKWAVKATSQPVAQFVDRTCKRFWSRSVPGIMRRYFDWGYSAGGVEYRVKRGRWLLDTVRAIQSPDARVMVYTRGPKAGDVAGFQTASTGDVLGRYAFWFAGNGEHGRHYDPPPIAWMYDAWLEKNERGGALNLRHLVARKHAVRPAVIRHPSGEQTWRDTDGTTRTIPNQQLAISALELYESGANVALDSAVDEHGNYLWDLTPAEAGPDVKQPSDYVDALDIKMGEAVGLPAEVVRAAASGSGYSGRSVPEKAWLGGVDEYVGLLFEAFDRSPLRAMVHQNFGPRADYEIEPQSLVPPDDPPAAGPPPNSPPDSPPAPPNPPADLPADVHTGPTMGDPQGDPFELSAYASQSKQDAKLADLRRTNAARFALLAMFRLRERGEAEGDPAKYAAAIRALAEAGSDPDAIRAVFDADDEGTADRFDMAWNPYRSKRKTKGGDKGIQIGWVDDATGRVVYQKQKPGTRREKAAADAATADDLLARIDAAEPADRAAHLRALADHLPALPLAKLREVRARLGGTFGGQRTRAAGMVEALAEHFRLRAATDEQHEAPDMVDHRSRVAEARDLRRLPKADPRADLEGLAGDADAGDGPREDAIVPAPVPGEGVPPRGAAGGDPLPSDEQLAAATFVPFKGGASQHAAKIGTVEIGGKKYLFKPLSGAAAANEQLISAAARIAGVQVPDTGVRTVPGRGPGALSAWVDGHAAMDDPDAVRRDGRRDQMDRHILFSFLVADKDRHAGNYMMRPNGDIVSIDHEFAFASTKKKRANLARIKAEMEAKRGTEEFDPYAFDDLEQEERDVEDQTDDESGLDAVRTNALRKFRADTHGGFDAGAIRDMAEAGDRIAVELTKAGRPDEAAAVSRRAATLRAWAAGPSTTVDDLRSVIEQGKTNGDQSGGVLPGGEEGHGVGAGGHRAGVPGDSRTGDVLHEPVRGDEPPAGAPGAAEGAVVGHGRAGRPAGPPVAPARRPDGTPHAPTVHDVHTVPTAALKADPKRFQYKVSGIGPGGVTKELKGTQKWNPALGGTLLAWRDPETGQDYVVNGHHRHELAGRVGQGTVNARYIDAATAEEARAQGALANIAEGRGTATDAAKFLRDTGGTVERLREAGVSLSGKVAADAVALTALSPKAFQAVTDGTLDEPPAVAVARHLPDPKLQDQLFAHIAARQEDGKDWTPSQIEVAAKKMASAGRTTVAGRDLFGDFEDEHSTFDQEVELEHHVGRVLGTEANDYGVLASKRRAEATAGAGNTLNTRENARLRDAAASNADLFDRHRHLKGPVAEAIKAAAAKLATAKTKKEKDRVKSEAVESVRAALGRVGTADEFRRPAESPDAGAVGAGDGRGADADRVAGAGADAGGAGETGAGSREAVAAAVVPPPAENSGELRDSPAVGSPEWEARMEAAYDPRDHVQDRDDEPTRAPDAHDREAEADAAELVARREGWEADRPESLLARAHGDLARRQLEDARAGATAPRPTASAPAEPPAGPAVPATQPAPRSAAAPEPRASGTNPDGRPPGLIPSAARRVSQFDQSADRPLGTRLDDLAGLDTLHLDAAMEAGIGLRHNENFRLLSNLYREWESGDQRSPRLKQMTASGLDMVEKDAKGIVDKLRAAGDKPVELATGQTVTANQIADVYATVLPRVLSAVRQAVGGPQNPGASAASPTPAAPSSVPESGPPSSDAPPEKEEGPSGGSDETAIPTVTATAGTEWKPYFPNTESHKTKRLATKRAAELQAGGGSGSEFEYGVIKTGGSWGVVSRRRSRPGTAAFPAPAGAVPSAPMTPPDPEPTPTPTPAAETPPWTRPPDLRKVAAGMAPAGSHPAPPPEAFPAQYEYALRTGDWAALRAMAAPHPEGGRPGGYLPSRDAIRALIGERFGAEAKEAAKKIPTPARMLDRLIELSGGAQG